MVPKLKQADSVVRVYCSHIFHYECIDKMMNKPPFNGEFDNVVLVYATFVLYQECAGQRIETTKLFPCVSAI